MFIKKHGFQLMRKYPKTCLHELPLIALGGLRQSANCGRWY